VSSNSTAHFPKESTRQNNSFDVIAIVRPLEFNEGKMNHSHSNQNIEKTSLVSSRRGRNFLSHNLEKNDVVFGTKGNGRNEIFLKVLESHSEQYMQLSKFQKMGLIQKIIRDWKGNFYIMNCKTNDLSLAKKMDHNLSSTDPYSRKLYTSVRRMMNYVNSKIQRQPYYFERSKSVESSPVISSSSIEELTIQAYHIPSITSNLPKKGHEKKPIKKTSVPHVEIANSATQKKHSAVLALKNYISKNLATLPLPENTVFTFPFSPTSMRISSHNRSAMMVTPEPSPRALVQTPPPIPPLPFSKPLSSKNSTRSIAPYLLHSELLFTRIGAKNTVKDSYSRQQGSVSAIIATSKKLQRNPHSVDNTIGDMEESAILALTRLGSSSSMISS